jgi:hypothetical protein
LHNKTSLISAEFDQLFVSDRKMPLLEMFLLGALVTGLSLVDIYLLNKFCQEKSKAHKKEERGALIPYSNAYFPIR